MALLLISLCLVFSIAPLASASKPYYVVIAPAQMTQSTQSKACVIILGLQGEAKLKMELKKDDNVQQITDDVINSAHYFHCYTFKLPNVGEEKEIWLLHASIKGENVNLEQNKKILIINTLVTFIQTDKLIYHPGQTVNFRIVTLDMAFQAQNNKYPLVQIKDSNADRIAQWLDVSPDRGIASISFPLANELPLGEYTISIPGFYATSFLVAEYVLQRFEVDVEIPSGLTVLDEAVTVKVCGRFTYGKPVQGLIDLSVCKKELPSFLMPYLENSRMPGLEFILSLLGESEEEECQNIEGFQTDENGCVSRVFETSKLNISKTNPLQYLRAKALLTETSTGDTENAAAYSLIGNFEIMDFFEKIEHYQRGVPLTVKGNPAQPKNSLRDQLQKDEPTTTSWILLKGKNSKPKADETVYLVVGIEEKDVNLTAVTDAKGLATFELDTSEWDDMVSLEGKFSLDNNETHGITGSMAQIWIHPFYSESNSFLKVTANMDTLDCMDQLSVNVEHTINKNKLDPNSDQQSFFYFLLSKGAIVNFGEYKLDISTQSTSSELHGHFSLKFTKTIDMFPDVTFVVFTILSNGEVVAERRTFPVPMCLNNKVELRFSKNQVHPGEKVGLKVKAESGSICSVRSVDKRILLQRLVRALNLPTDLIKETAREIEVNRRGFPYAIEDFENYPCLRNENDEGPDRYEGAWYSSEADVYRLLKESNLKVFTNARIRKPVVCDLPKANYTKRISPKRQKPLERQLSGKLFATKESIEGLLPENYGHINKPAKKSEKRRLMIRKDFAETWLFDLLTVGPMGYTELNVTTPHTITKYVTDAFCIGKFSGFGQMSNVELSIFKPYFIDLIVPHSVVQGETCTIKALIFNYLRACAVVFVSLSDVGDHSALKSKDQEKCICAEETATFTWNVSISQIGNQKVHVSSGSVQLEGGCTDKVHMMNTDNIEDNIEKRIVVKPRGVLEEKTQTSFLCPSENSIQDEMSLDLPEKYIPGSEEARLLVLGDVMGISITNIEKAISDPKGCAEENIMMFIPNFHIIKYLEATNRLTPEIKDKAISYLTKGFQRQQLFRSENGSYTLFTGSKPSTWLTAFTIRSFVHAQELIYIPEHIIDDAVRWLSNVQLPNGCFKKVGRPFSTYLQREEEDEVALTAYIAVTLLERKVHEGDILEKALTCLKDSVNKVNSTYTQAVMAYAFTLSGDKDLRKQILESLDESAEKTDSTKHWEGDLQDHGGVEISAYIVLAKLSDETTSHDDIEEALPIIRWMVKKQNSGGVYLSEQNTVVGLQALTKFTKAIYKNNQDVDVSVRSLSGFQKQFKVDKTNSLLYQSERLTDIPGVYRVTATGNGCVYVQTYLKYYIPTEKSETFFSLNVSTEPSVCTYQSKRKFEIHISLSYSTERPTGNIAIIEVEMLSGYLPHRTSLKKLEKRPGVGRMEITDDKVKIYLEKQLTLEPSSLIFSVKQNLHVGNLQPAVVTVHDYSSPDESAVAEYNSPCSSDSEDEGNA